MVILVLWNGRLVATEDVQSVICNFYNVLHLACSQKFAQALYYSICILMTAIPTGRRNSEQSLGK